MTALAPPKRYGKRGFSRMGDAAKTLIRKPLAKRGFAQSRLLTDWESVVGAQIASLAHPLRLSHAAQEGLGGTLTIGVLGVRALEAQHAEPTIIERVNAHYGYRAVARIRIAQIGAEAFATPSEQAASPEPTPDQTAKLKIAVSGVTDQALRDALERLGRNITAHSSAETHR